MTFPAADTAKPSPARFGVLALLFLVYSFNFIDRQIIGILAVPIKTELHASDTLMGLLGGPAFALFYTLLGVPIAWLADRTSRTWIMTLALVVWSGFTAVCGVAANFWQLFAARVGVGVGEAGGVAPAYSLITDYFPPRERARAMAVYSFGIPLGSAAGVLLGGIVASLVDWRVAFLAVGLAGVAIAPFFRALVREPERGRFDAAPAAKERVSLGKAFATLAPKPSFWLMSIGAGCSSLVNYGVFFWTPSFIVRSFHYTLLDASKFYATILLVGGVIGVAFGGVLADWLGKRSRAFYAAIPAVAFCITAPLFVGGLLSYSPATAFLFFLPPTAFALAWLGPVITAVQHLGPANMRSTASALFLFINNLLGLGLGTLVIGAISQALTAQFGDDALRYSMIVGAGFYLLAAVFFALAARFLKRDWQD
ncbi:MAG TPA: MFS transporter [Caulobacterales bacterium]|nr:MFS transporter [Caulobacterales bacterium]